MKSATPFQKGIQKLKTSLTEIKEQIANELQRERDIAEKRGQRLKELKRKQEVLSPQKLELAEQIMKWVREFTNSDLFAELLSLGYGDEEDQILIRIGPQGHRLDEKRRYGRWSRIYLGSGALFYQSGFKYMPYENGAEKITDEHNLVALFTYYYLVGLQKYIESGEVYEFIQEECHRNVWLAKAHVRDHEVEA